VAQRLQAGNAIKLVNKNPSFMGSEISYRFHKFFFSGSYPMPVQWNLRYSVCL